MDNIEIAEIFRTITSAISFGSKSSSDYGSYLRAAKSIAEQVIPLEQLYEEGRLLIIPQVGPKSASILEQILDRMPTDEIIAGIVYERLRSPTQTMVSVLIRPYANKSNKEIIQTYQQNWNGTSARNLAVLTTDLYLEMRSRGLLHITGSPLGLYQAMSDQELIRLGRKRFREVKRGELPERTFNSSGYVKALRIRNLYGKVQPRPLGTGGKWMSRSNEVLLRFYRRFYGGLTPTQLAIENSGFYGALRKKRLLHNLPYLQRRWSSREQVRKYYKTHFGGKTRTQVAREDYGFYQALQYRGMLNELPTTEPWRDMGDDELKEYYHKNHEGLPRGKLRLIDNNFYRALIRRDLIDIVPYSFPSPK